MCNYGIFANNKAFDKECDNITLILDEYDNLKTRKHRTSDWVEVNCELYDNVWALIVHKGRRDIQIISHCLN